MEAACGCSALGCTCRLGRRRQCAVAHVPGVYLSAHSPPPIVRHPCTIGYLLPTHMHTPMHSRYHRTAWPPARPPGHPTPPHLPPHPTYRPTAPPSPREELEALAAVVAEHPRLLVLSDEIYEYIVSAAACCSWLEACRVRAEQRCSAHTMCCWACACPAVDSTPADSVHCGDVPARADCTTAARARRRRCMHQRSTTPLALCLACLSARLQVGGCGRAGGGGGWVSAG